MWVAHGSECHAGDFWCQGKRGREKKMCRADSSRVVRAKHQYSLWVLKKLFAFALFSLGEELEQLKGMRELEMSF